MSKKEARPPSKAFATSATAPSSAAKANGWNSRLTRTSRHRPSAIKQFSDEYFALAQRYGRTMSQYLVFDEPVLLNLDGQAYLIEP